MAIISTPSIATKILRTKGLISKFGSGTINTLIKAIKSGTKLTPKQGAILKEAAELAFPKAIRLEKATQSDDKENDQ